MKKIISLILWLVALAGTTYALVAPDIRWFPASTWVSTWYYIMVQSGTTQNKITANDFALSISGVFNFAPSSWWTLTWAYIPLSGNDVSTPVYGDIYFDRGLTGNSYLGMLSYPIRLWWATWIIEMLTLRPMAYIPAMGAGMPILWIQWRVFQSSVAGGQSINNYYTNSTGNLGRSQQFNSTYSEMTFTAFTWGIGWGGTNREFVFDLDGTIQAGYDITPVITDIKDFVTKWYIDAQGFSTWGWASLWTWVWLLTPIYTWEISVNIGKNSFGVIWQWTFSMGENSYAWSYYGIAMGYGAKVIDSSAQHSIAMGNNAITSWANSVAIGTNARTLNNTSRAFWYNANAVGDSSMALGNNTTSNGQWSSSIGFWTISSGQYSTAIWYNSLANGAYSIAIGWASATANGDYCFAAVGAICTQSYAIAMWNTAQANAKYSISMGEGTTTAGDYSVAMWLSTSTVGESSVALWKSSSSQWYASFAGWYSTVAWATWSTTFGRETAGYGVNGFNVGQWNKWLTWSIFEIGIGTSVWVRVNAVTVLASNWYAGFWIDAPTQAVDVNWSIQSNSWIYLTGWFAPFRFAYSGSSVVAEFYTGGNRVTVTAFVLP